jgi:hypothetical protein
MPQKFNSCDYAVLAERKPAHTVIARRTQPARTLIALNDGRILSMVATVHHFLKPTSPTVCSGHRHPVSCLTAPAIDPLRSFVSFVPGVVEVAPEASRRY